MTTPVVLFEDWAWRRFLPLAYVRPVFRLTCGVSSLLERTRIAASSTGRELAGVWCRPVLAEVEAERSGLPVNDRPNRAEPDRGLLLLNGRGRWRSLPDDTGDGGNEAWVGTTPTEPFACIRADAALLERLEAETLLDESRLRATLAHLPRRDVAEHVRMFAWPWEVVLANPSALAEDWSGRRDDVRREGRVHDGAYLLNETDVHLGKGTVVKPCAVIDAEEGPVWIDDDVTIMPHTLVQGPAYVGPRTMLQPGAMVRAGTTIGPRCKIGGEIEGSIVHGYSNKQHDGFLGHSYVAEWVNIAADCINSDLKNTYGVVRVPINGREVDTGETFVGMLVGDHSKLGINVSSPTGAVVGFCSSVFAAQSPKFVPSFAWIDHEKVVRYGEQRGLELAKRVMARRQREMTPAEERLFLSVRKQALAIEVQQQWEIERAASRGPSDNPGGSTSPSGET